MRKEFRKNATRNRLCIERMQALSHRQQAWTAGVSARGAVFPVCDAISEQTFLPLQIAKAAKVGEHKGEAVLVLVGYGAKLKAPVFHIQTTAIPVVGRLQG
jgi:hypothetical protein